MRWSQKCIELKLYHFLHEIQFHPIGNRRGGCDTSANWTLAVLPRCLSFAKAMCYYYHQEPDILKMVGVIGLAPTGITVQFPKLARSYLRTTLRCLKLTMDLPTR